MSEEIFDVVDDRDRVIGKQTRREVHRRGLKHRAVHVLVFNARGEVYLQKRSFKKDTFPGAWDSSASGHLDSGETYDACSIREAREESGLEVELLGERPPTTEPGTRALIAPRFLDIHRINATHEHIGMIYWARPLGGNVTLATEEHHDIRWVGAAELDSLQPPMTNAVKWYCRKALEEVRKTNS